MWRIMEASSPCPKEKRSLDQGLELLKQDVDSKHGEEGDDE